MYSGQREQALVISSSYAKHTYVPTVFAPVHESYDSMAPKEDESDDGGEDDEDDKMDQTHPPNLSEVTTLITKSG